MTTDVTFLAYVTADWKTKGIEELMVVQASTKTVVRMADSARWLYSGQWAPTRAKAVAQVRRKAKARKTLIYAELEQINAVLADLKGVP